MKKKFLAFLTVAGLAVMTACSSQTQTAATDATDAAEAVSTAAEETSEAVVEASVEVEPAGEDNPEEAGFEEIEIWADEEVGFLNVNGVYFQPVQMSAGQGLETYGTEGFNMHFEADVSALPNNLGYGTGDWVPYMQVDFEIYNADGVAAEGSFMPMNADDGNHYGANINLPDAGLYSVKLTFHSPGENGFLIHLDDETGPGGSLDDFEWPLVLDLEDVWEYTPGEW